MYNEKEGKGLEEEKVDEDALDVPKPNNATRQVTEYQSHYNDIVKIVRRKPRDPQMRVQVMEDNLTYASIGKNMDITFERARDPARGAGQGREEEYYLHRAEDIL